MGRVHPVRRHPVLVVLQQGGTVEVYGERNINVHVARAVCAAHRANEGLADDLTYELLPKQYQRLYAAWSLRGVGSCPRPDWSLSQAEEARLLRAAKRIYTTDEQAHLVSLEGPPVAWGCTASD